MPKQHNHEGWVLIPPAIDNDTSLSDSEKRLLGKVIGFVDQYGDCWKGNQYIATSLTWSVDKVRRIVSKVVELGYLERDLKKSADLKTTRKLTPTNKCYRLRKNAQSSAQKRAVSNTHKQVGGFPTTTDSDEEEEPTLMNLSTEPIEAWDEIENYPDYYDMSPIDLPGNPADFKKTVLAWAEKAPEQGRSVEGLHPCTYEEIWALAKELRLSIGEVTDTHRRLIESINAGNKYKVVEVYPMLRRWLRNDINAGRMEQMDEVQMLSLDKQYEPIQRRKRRFYAQLRKRRQEGK